MSNGHNVSAVGAGSFPLDKHRRVLEVHADQGEGGCDIIIAGGRPFHLDAGERWLPYHVPMTAFVVEGEATVIIS